MIATSAETERDCLVIVIDDDPTIHMLVKTMLKPLGVRIVSAMSGEEGIAAARAETPYLVLLDNDMPGATGLEVLERIKSDPTLSELPVIMETGSENNKTLSACFAAGAIDYIRKPFTAAELRARVGSVLERQRLVSELTNAARFDKLTGLPNRALLHDRLTGALKHVHADASYGFTLLFLDFDRFKFINDSLGHDAGDLLLKAIAGRLRKNLRATDSSARDASGTTVARLGGDEFVVILDNVTAPHMADGIARRLLEALSTSYQLGPHSVRSSASIGVVHSSTEYSTADDMLRDADIAMYEAKARGKSCQVTFTSGMGMVVRERIDIENDLRNALGTSQLRIVYQPIVSLDTNIVCGAEALVRWIHPTRGEVPPSVFIPIAEETGMILSLSAFVLREACADFMRWQRTTLDQPLDYVSVNLSRMQFADPDLIDNIERVLNSAGMQPQQLQLEVTESLIMLNRAVAARLLQELRSRGIRIAMDDFGTGHSSLSCLQEFPLDVLKVDRAFVANANRGRDFAALLHAVVTLADNLGLAVIAEGIEDAEQLVLLQALGCAYGQGFLMSPPIPADDLAQLIGAA